MISNFVTLSDYCVLEYKQHPLGDPAPEIISSSFHRLTNNHLELLQVYNVDGDLTKTHNIKDITVTPIGNSRLALLDSDVFPEYQEYDNSLTQIDIDSGVSANLVFDTIRFHFASGFNFEEVGAVIVGMKQKMNNLKNFIFANIVLDSITSEEILVFNTRPLYLGNAVYDKYIDIKVPSIKYLDQNFDQFGPLSFEYAITDGVGFIKNSPMTVFLQEASKQTIYTEQVEYASYMVTENYEASVSQTNEFDSLGAVIEEAQDGDYINYFATWNGAFPEDLIAVLNSRGTDQNWILIHQLQVYEQVGSEYFPSGNIVIYQENNFGEPLSYRPIIKNASVAISMTIDYTLRLYNKGTSENVIRTGSLTIFNPNKYGKSLAKISLDGGPQSHVVYNKIFQKAFETSAFNVILGNQTSTVTIQEKKVAAPVFFHKSNVMLSSRNALISSVELGDEVVYGQGKMILPIDPTDNYIRFNIFKKVSTSQTPVPMSLNMNASFRLIFGKSSKLEYTNMKNASFENLQYGQIAFKISKAQALKILDLEDDIFTITVVSEDGTESMLYTGRWRYSADYQTILQNEQANVDEILQAQKTAELLESLNKKINDLENQVTYWKNAAQNKKFKVGNTQVEPTRSLNAISSLQISSASESSQNSNLVSTVIQKQDSDEKSEPMSVIIKNKINKDNGTI